MDVKVVKRFVPEIICGAVVLAAVGAWYYTTAYAEYGEGTGLQAQMQTRLKKADEARTLARTSISIPSGQPGVADYSPKGGTGAVTQAVIDAKKRVMNWIKEQANSIAKIVSKDNCQGRVDTNGNPLLGGTPYTGVLPKADSAKLFPFRDEYNDAYYNLLAKLVMGEVKVPDGMDKVTLAYWGGGLSQKGITEGYEEYKRKMVASAGRTPTGEAITPAGMLTLSGFARQQANQIAATRRIYATINVFQRPSWLADSNPPDETKIFEGLMVLWPQQDIVNAICAVNKGQNIAENPIKRLHGIAVGSTAGSVSLIRVSDTNEGVTSGGGPAGGNPGALFLTQSSMPVAPVVGGPGGKRGPAPVAAPAAAGINYSDTMTGRVGTERYDVTRVKFVVDIEPSAINKLIREIYHLNNGYTVLQVNLTTVDPFETASYGYLYGKVPVVRAEIVLEATFFRDWTTKIMPESYKTLLGIQPADAAAGGAAGGRF